MVHASSPASSFVDLRADELVIDLFAGGGGASVGIEAAIGRPVDHAVNHDPIAVAMHRVNHPMTIHHCEDVWAVDPLELCGRRRVGFLWASPDCTHHSRAKGTMPLSSGRRALADVVITWIDKKRPRVICLENVVEFADWCPLDENGRPDKSQKGASFRAWLAKFVDAGYNVESRVLVAADYGTPTTRKRLFVVARCDGLPIVWPMPTHGKGRAEPWQPAWTIIDWGLPCRSIFGRDKPLAEATQNRIAMGLRRYVLEAEDPFVIPFEDDSTAPFLTKFHGGARGHTRGQVLEEPIRTVDASNRFALVEPFMVRHGHYSTITGAGLREGCGAGTFRGQSIRKPVATACATNDKHLVMPFIAKNFGGPNGHQTPGIGVRSPFSAVTAKDHHAFVASFFTKFYGTSTGSSARSPLPTVLAGGGKGGSHIAAVRAFLVKYYGAQGRAAGQSPKSPLHTVTTKDRFGLVTVAGELCQLADIRMRMLEALELFLAQGFKRTYNITPRIHGKPITKTDQVRLAGNSVCPQLAEALVRANVRVEHRAVA